MTIAKVLKFLTEKYQDGANYGTLNSARSALAIIANMDIANNELVKKFIKGSGKTRSSRPRYDSTWDEPVLNKLEEDSHWNL